MRMDQPEPSLAILAHGKSADKPTPEPERLLYKNFLQTLNCLTQLAAPLELLKLCSSTLDV